MSNDKEFDKEIQKDVEELIAIVNIGTKVQELLAITHIAKQMRKAQQEYFKTRTQKSMQQAKQLEFKLDSMLAKIPNLQEPQNQNLF